MRSENRHIIITVTMLLLSVNVCFGFDDPGMFSVPLLQSVKDRDVEKIAEDTVEKAIEKAEIMTKRPGEWGETTKIHFFVFIMDIGNIDDVRQSFNTNVYVRLRWKDGRLAHEGSMRTVPLAEIWNPRVMLVNRGGIVQKTLPEEVEIVPDGTVTYYQRYSGPLSQALKLAEFPFDQHDFTIQFVATGYSSDEIEFIPDSSMAESSTPGVSAKRSWTTKDSRS